MIRIEYFSPLDNFSKSAYEFDAENITYKYKSLYIEAERKIEYQRIKFIELSNRANPRWFYFLFVFICAVVFLNSIALLNLAHNPFSLTNPAFQVIDKALIILGFVIFILSLRKNELVSLFDEDREYLATISVNKKNRGFMLEGLDLIKRKTEIIIETNPANSFPDKLVAFEVVQFEILDFLNKSTTKFYEDRLIDVEKSLAEEVTTEVLYSELSGKTQIVKLGNDKANFVWIYFLFFLDFVVFPLDVFFPQLMDSRSRMILVVGMFALTTVAYFLLKFDKRETFLFYGHKDRVLYWTRVNNSNRKRMYQIVGYVQDHIPHDINSENPSERISQ
jgi:hypothetical protein